MAAWAAEVRRSHEASSSPEGPPTGKAQLGPRLALDDRHSAAPDGPLLDPAPDADRAEQQRPAIASDIGDEPFTIAPDVPEADAIEQACPVPPRRGRRTSTDAAAAAG